MDAYSCRSLLLLFPVTVIIEAVRFLQVDNMKMVWYTSLHSGHSEIEPLHVPLRVQIRSKYKLVFLWATADRIAYYAINELVSRNSVVPYCISYCIMLTYISIAC